MKIEIRNGRVIDSDSGFDGKASVYIENGRIKAVGKVEDDFGADRVVDASNMIVMPGMVDLNVSLREPGEEAKGTVLSETRAAAAGGITALCCTPDSDPVNDSAAVTNLILELGARAGYAKVFPVGALSRSLLGNQLSEMDELIQAGCVALSNAGYPIKDQAFLLNCFKYAKTQKAKIFYLPKIESMSRGCVNEGVVSAALGLQGIPAMAESIAVAQAILMAQATGLSIHLSLISSAQSVELIKRAKEDGVSVTADVAIANLVFTEEAVAHYDSRYHCYPPLRSEGDRQALLQGIREGVIDAIVSAHRPHDAAAKQAPFAESGSGMSTLELMLPLAMMLDQSNELDFSRFVDATTVRPASIIGQPLGQLSAGRDADVLVVDPQAQWEADENSILSSGKNTPIWQQQMAGRVVHTFIRGKEVS